MGSIEEDVLSLQQICTRFDQGNADPSDVGRLYEIAARNHPGTPFGNLLHISPQEMCAYMNFLLKSQQSSKYFTAEVESSELESPWILTQSGGWRPLSKEGATNYYSTWGAAGKQYNGGGSLSSGKGAINYYNTWGAAGKQYNGGGSLSSGKGAINYYNTWGAAGKQQNGITDIPEELLRPITSLSELGIEYAPEEEEEVLGEETLLSGSQMLEQWFPTETKAGTKISHGATAGVPEGLLQPVTSFSELMARFPRSVENGLDSLLKG